MVNLTLLTAAQSCYQTETCSKWSLIGAVSMWEAADTHYTNCTTKQRQMGRSKQRHAAVTQCGASSLYWSCSWCCLQLHYQTKADLVCKISWSERQLTVTTEVPSVAPYMPSCSGLQLPFDNFVQLVCKYVCHIWSQDWSLHTWSLASIPIILLTACK